jgi:hypothetical protein
VVNIMKHSTARRIPGRAAWQNKACLPAHHPCCQHRPWQRLELQLVQHLLVALLAHHVSSSCRLPGAVAEQLLHGSPPQLIPVGWMETAAWHASHRLIKTMNRLSRCESAACLHDTAAGPPELRLGDSFHPVQRLLDDCQALEHHLDALLGLLAACCGHGCRCAKRLLQYTGQNARELVREDAAARSRRGAVRSAERWQCSQAGRPGTQGTQGRQSRQGRTGRPSGRSAGNACRHTVR